MKSFVDNLKNINSIKELFSFYSKISDKEDEYLLVLYGEWDNYLKEIKNVLNKREHIKRKK